MDVPDLPASRQFFLQFKERAKARFRQIDDLDDHPRDRSAVTASDLCGPRSVPTNHFPYSGHIDRLKRAMAPLLSGSNGLRTSAEFFEGTGVSLKGSGIEEQKADKLGLLVVEQELDHSLQRYLGRIFDRIAVSAGAD